MNGNQQLLARARAGEPAAQDALVRTLRPRMTRMAQHYARVCGENADDLLQDAWVGLLDALPGLDITIGTPEQYLLRCARWRLLDAVKRDRLRRCLPLDGKLAEALSEPVGDDLGRVSVTEFARGLKATQQSVLHCLLRGLTWREAGDALGCTSANVAYHVRQIQREYQAWNGDIV